MRKVQYGKQEIEYSAQVKNGLKAHYITVARDSGVVLKGKTVTPNTADKLILKKAGWILNKLEAVGSPAKDRIVTGSRLPYLGKSYYVEVIQDRTIIKPKVEFTYSKFIIKLKGYRTSQEQIKEAVQDFYKAKAIQKITPRIARLAARARIKYHDLSFRKMNKRWGSCTPGNKIVINYEAVKLPFSLIDYLIIHELCHTRVKDHSKAYWAELSKHVPRWRELDEILKTIKL